MTINTYHGYFAYNFGGSDAKVVPYVLGGFGATSYGGVDYTRLNGGTGTIGGQTKFSSTWGFGVKAYPGKTRRNSCWNALHAGVHQVGLLRAGGATRTGGHATWSAMRSMLTSSTSPAV